MSTQYRSSIPLSHGSTWYFGLRAQIRVIGALVIREAMSRYGHENLGFFWVIIEPLLFSCGVMVLWSLAHMSHGGGIDVVPFALSGYTFITMWRHITGRSIHAIKQHALLSYYRQVKIVDALIAMAVLETLACFTAFMVAYTPLTLLNLCPVMSDPLNLIGGFFLTGAFSLGFGLFLAGIAQMNHVVSHIVPALMYLTMPLTGIFTMQEWLPKNIRDILLWSPLVNGVEMFRSGLFSNEVTTHWSLEFLVVTTVLSLTIGYIAFNRGQRHD